MFLFKNTEDLFNIFYIFSNFIKSKTHFKQNSDISLTPPFPYASIKAYPFSYTLFNFISFSTLHSLPFYFQPKPHNWGEGKKKNEFNIWIRLCYRSFWFHRIMACYETIGAWLYRSSHRTRPRSHSYIIFSFLFLRIKFWNFDKFLQFRLLIILYTFNKLLCHSLNSRNYFPVIFL